MIRPTTSKKISTALLLSTLAKPAEPLHQPSPTDAYDVNSKIVTLLHTSDSVTASHDMSSNNSIIVKGMQEKKHILMAYQEKIGSKYPELIVTRKKGKISNDTSLHCACMRPSLDKWYRVGDLHLYNFITTIIKECRVSFLKEDISNLHLVNKDFANIIPKVLHWLRVNFTPLQDPRLGYEQQDHINLYRMEMASAAMIHFGLDPVKCVCFLSGKYTGQYWDIRRTLDAIQDHVTSDDYGHTKRILLNGCPAQLTFEEPLNNKLEVISRGNLKSFVENPQLVHMTMSKEDHYSHWVPMDPLLCKLSPYLCHTTQSIVIKDGKNNCIVWDGSTVTQPTDIVMNQITPVTQEAPVTFGHVKSQIYTDIYNTRISYPNATILLGLADVKACFRYPRIHADLTGAFGFIADELYNLATAMVFGSTASASSWDAFRRAIKALTKVFATRPDLVVRHKKFIDMLKWEEIVPSAKLTPAFSCTINRGIMDDAGNWIDHPACIYVDNALMLALNADHMKMVLAATIEAIFIVMDEPDIAVRQCPLAMDKWLELVIGPKQTMLGLIINTNRLTVAISPKYLQEVLELLNSTWHPN